MRISRGIVCIGPMSAIAFADSQRRHIRVRIELYRDGLTYKYFGPLSLSSLWGSLQLTAKIISAKPLARSIIQKVKESVNELNSLSGVVPGLAVVLVGNQSSSLLYVKSKQKAAEKCGINSKIFRLKTDIGEEGLLEMIGKLNRDNRFHGILVQFPLPLDIDMLKVISSVDPSKDIEGLHPLDSGWLLAGKPRFVPCTPGGIHRLLMSIGQHPEGQHVVVCGGSLIVGRPLAALLLQETPWANATVTICHRGTRNLSAITHMADILVVATGNPRGITGDMVKEGSVVVDVGIHRIADDTKKNGYRLVGDVDFHSVKEKAFAITPVPGGVGLMTVAMLMVNTLKAARLSVASGIAPFQVEDWENLNLGTLPIEEQNVETAEPIC